MAKKTTQKTTAPKKADPTQDIEIPAWEVSRKLAGLGAVLELCADAHDGIESLDLAGIGMVLKTLSKDAQRIAEAAEHVAR